MIPGSVTEALQAFARLPSILVACDYDGTLSPIVEDPSAATPCRESVAALRALAGLPDTHVAVISGRSLRDLAALSRLPSEIHLVGSHGSEFDVGFARAIPPDALVLRDRVIDAVEEIASGATGSIVERKPTGVALHVRRTETVLGDAAVAAVKDGPGSWPGVYVKLGKKVVELSVVATDKGRALEHLRSALSVDAALFVGDDVTDEDAFAVLRGPDIGIKVGQEPTRAALRLDDVDGVARALALLADARREWIEGAGAEPIERHTLLSDLRTVALVQHDGRITWLCHPRADSPSVFAQLLGGSTAGSFGISPVPNTAPLVQRYLPGSLVVETRWPDLTVTDYLDRSLHGATSAGRTTLVRRIEGHGRVRIDFGPRLDFGRAATQLVPTNSGLEVTGTSERIRLHAPGVEWQIHGEGMHQTAVADVSLSGGAVTLVMQLGVDGDEGDPLAVNDEPTRRERTLSSWREWVDTLDLPSQATAVVARSALTLKALCHEPSGAILAAATTSLPEVVGGVRNWDYRLCWPRDAALTATSLLSLGSSSEAVAFLDWLVDRVHHLPSPEQLRPVYPLVGDEYLPEAVIPTLHGYRGSRPVRIGNAAEHQVQLDVFGPVVDLVDRLTAAGLELRAEWWWLVEQMAHAVARRWDQPDHGMWEERRPQRHHVHSKVMCWLTIDRAISIAERTGRSVRHDWAVLRERIATDVLERGWHPEVGAFTIAYSDGELDAAALFVGLSGLLRPDDPRFVSTVARIEQQLREGPVTYRYRLDDGLPGQEGGFHICTSWLVRSYVLLGRRAEAEMLFDRMIALVGPTGMLSEQYDPIREVALGNVPQAYSHLGIIDAAVALGTT